MNAKTQLYLILGSVAAIVLFIVWKGWGGAASAVAGAAVSAAGGAVAGTAEGIGAQVGLPMTDPQKCEMYCAAGDGLHASIYCSASRFVTYLENGK